MKNKVNSINEKVEKKVKGDLSVLTTNKEDKKKDNKVIAKMVLGVVKEAVYDALYESF